MPLKRPGLLETIWQDTRFALRGIRNNPVMTTTAVLTLALAIGGNTTMFTLIRAVLLNPLQYPDPGQLVMLTGGATPTRFAEMRANAHSFIELGAFVGPENITLSGGAEPEVLKGVRVSADFLNVPSVQPIIGRSFRTTEDSAGGSPVAMISTELWERHFQSDPHVAGKTATLGSVAYTIIGVLPPHFPFPLRGLDVWMTAPSEEPLMAADSRALSPYLTVFGRLKPRLSVEQADAEMKVLRHQYALAHPAMLDAKPKPVEVTLMKNELVASVRTMLWMLFGAVSFVLLIACANVAGLLMVRASSRAREFALRSALGAGRSRLIQQLLVESVLLFLTSGGLGLLLAVWSLQTIPKLAVFDLPRGDEVRTDWIALGFTAALSVATGMVFGLAPSLGASRPDLMATLRASGAAVHRGAQRRILKFLEIRSVLVIGQIGFSVVLLIGAALMVETIAYLSAVNVGFNPSHLLTMRVTLPPSRYDTDRKKDAFYDSFIQTVKALPGVRNSTAAAILPMMGQPGTPVQNATQPLLKLNQRPIEAMLLVTPGYFSTLGIPMKRGRDFNEQDREQSQRVTIIDENAARQFWPSYPRGVDPVGQRLFIGGINLKPVEIVGVVGDVRQSLEGNAWPGTVYLPFSQGTPQSSMFAIRTVGDPLLFARAVREQLRLLDPDEPIADVRTMDALVEAKLGQRRLLMMLLGTFAAVALLLALVGMYGVISYSIVQRTQEVGIRRALGAQQRDVLWLVLREGLGLTLTGIGVGIGAAFVLTRLVRTLLFGVSPTDPATFLGIALLFLLVGLAASYIPAHRASKIDPMEALRT